MNFHKHIHHHSKRNPILSLLAVISAAALIVLLVTNGATILAQARSIFIELESGSLTSVTQKSSSNASGGKYIQFSSATDATPAPDPEPEPEPDPEPDPGGGDWYGYTKPSANNTGNTTSLAQLRTVPSGTIDQSWLNANNGGSNVISKVRFNGRINVEADNITIRDFYLDANGADYGVYNYVFTGNPSQNLVLEDGVITNVKSSGVVVSNTLMRRIEIKESAGDAIKPFSNVTVEGSWYHHLGTGDGAHADGIQMVSGSNNTFVGNFCDMPVNEKGGPGSPYKSNSCFIIQTNNGSISNIVMDKNWLSGGNYTVYVKDKGNGHGLPSGVSLRNNRFTCAYRYGLRSIDSGAGVTLSGNVWDHTDNSTSQDDC